MLGFGRSMLKPSLQNNVINDQRLIMVDFVSISIMTYIFPWFPITLSFTNIISAAFLDKGKDSEERQPQDKLVLYLNVTS